MPKLPKLKYDKLKLEEAVKEATDNDRTIPVRQIAAKYGIPRSTLRFYINNPNHKTSLGPSTILSSAEEKLLEDWIITSARKGFPRNKEDVLDSVQKFLEENPRQNPFTNNRPGDGWWKAFLKRHSRITTRTSEGVTKASACVSEKDIRGWFQEIRSYAEQNNLIHIFDQPHRIFNADEEEKKVVKEQKKNQKQKTKIIQDVKKTKKSPEVKKIQILGAVVMKPPAKCAVCNVAIVKNGIDCSVCTNKYHMQCIPKRHKEHIPDNSDVNLYLCHLCYRIDDSDSGGSLNSLDEDLYSNILKAKKNLDF